VTAESGVDQSGVRRRVFRTVATEDEAKRLVAREVAMADDQAAEDAAAVTAFWQ
jgi:hypothetical protein